MLSALFPSSSGGSDAEAGGSSSSKFNARAVHDALGAGLADLETFTAHTAQLTEELRRVQGQREEERKAVAREKQELEAAWLQRLRTARLDTAVRAGFAAADQRACARVLRGWAAAAGLLRGEELEQRREREQSLQLRLRDSGRAEILQERESLAAQAGASALAAQQLRATLQERSQELERTIVRDTMAFELWAADALRTKAALEAVHRERTDAERRWADESEALHRRIAEDGAAAAARARRRRPRRPRQWAARWAGWSLHSR